MKILNQKFFNRSTITVAKELLGKSLVAKKNEKEISLMVTETEAYDGPKDKASHASRGKTERAEPMFGEAGNFYIYLIYGMHYMLNVVTGPKNYPAAILIRGAEKIGKKNLKLNGPGKITKFLKINKKFNAKPANKKTGLWFEDLGVKIAKNRIVAGKRVGVDYAQEWRDKPYNFKLLK